MVAMVAAVAAAEALVQAGMEAAEVATVTVMVVAVAVEKDRSRLMLIGSQDSSLG
jgi:hypothetical protein